jgi:hypothetical protein
MNPAQATIQVIGQPRHHRPLVGFERPPPRATCGM